MTVILLGAAPEAGPFVRWGARGHEMAARAAIESLPTSVPEFFRSAGDQLAYLDPEPDRWRVGSRPEMSRAWAPDHYVNFENVSAEALGAADRYAYISVLQRAGIDRPDQRAGFLPFTIVELYQRLVTEWELWRRESSPTRRAWIQERIINDAGLLGHFVTDGSQPLHTTIHFNGWASGPNPQGYTQDRTLHSRFESAFVDRRVTQAELNRRVGEPRPVAGSVRAAVTRYLMTAHEHVEELYRLERDIGFDVEGAARPQAVDFAAERLADGARMLAVLWLTAWEESR
jgi:hypothetical protein